MYSSVSHVGLGYVSETKFVFPDTIVFGKMPCYIQFCKLMCVFLSTTFFLVYLKEQQNTSANISHNLTKTVVFQQFQNDPHEKAILE